MPPARRFCLLGYGALGLALAAALRRLGEAERIACVLTRPERSAPPFLALHDAGELSGAGVGIVLECAGQGAVAAHGAAILRQGIDLMLVSTGALADEALTAALRDAEREGGAKLQMAPGAIAGLDGLIAARLQGLARVTYTSTKPPAAWRGTAAEQMIDLDQTTEPRTFFEGSAREAARLFPRSANVAVSIGIAGIGLDETRVRLVSSGLTDGPRGLVEADGGFGSFAFDVYAPAAPGNPRSSLLTAYSLLQCARLGLGLPVFSLVDAECR